MKHAGIPYAELTEKEMQKLLEAERFLNSQPDHQKDRNDGREIILLAYNVKREEMQ